MRVPQRSQSTYSLQIILFVHPLHTMNPRVGADKELWKLWGFIHIRPVSVPRPVILPLDHKQMTLTMLNMSMAVYASLSRHGGTRTCSWWGCIQSPPTVESNPVQLQHLQHKLLIMFTGCSYTNQQPMLRLSVYLPVILWRLSFWSHLLLIHGTPSGFTLPHSSPLILHVQLEPAQGNKTICSWLRSNVSPPSCHYDCLVNGPKLPIWPYSTLSNA